MTYSLLQGVRVLEVGNFLSAPYCTKLLADMGADVIKLEDPRKGDEARRYGPFLHDIPHPERSGLFLYLNSSKRGVTLNIQTPTGFGLLKDLVTHADVLVHNISPFIADGIGLNYDVLSQANPRLVMTSVTPFGLTGEYKDYKAYDINLAAAAGLSVGFGERDREPLSFAMPQVGYFAGMCAASATVVALMTCEESGIGQHIDISEAECIASLYTGPEALMEVCDWRSTRRTGHHSMDFPYPNCILRCKDGYIFVGASEGHQWRKLLVAMENPSWANDPRFTSRMVMNNEYADEIDGYMEEWLTQYTKDELLQLALKHRIPLAPVRSFDEVYYSSSLADLFVGIERSDTGCVRYPGPPYKIGSGQHIQPTPAPHLGQDNRDVYCGLLGNTQEHMVELYKSGII